MRATFEKLARQRLVVETGMHSRWVAQRLGWAIRKLKLITENDSKSKGTRRLLSKLGCPGVQWLHPVY